MQQKLRLVSPIRTSILSFRFIAMIVNQKQKIESNHIEEVSSTIEDNSLFSIISSFYIEHKQKQMVILQQNMPIHLSMVKTQGLFQGIM